MKNKWVWAMIFLLAAVLGVIVSLWSHRNDFDGRELPSGAANMRTYHYPAQWSKQLKGRKDVGRIVFRSYCITCHGRTPKIPLSAPRIGDRRVWSGLERLGIDKLLAMTIQGVAAMPARGGCFECSDDQLKSAIQYMIKAR